MKITRYSQNMYTFKKKINKLPRFNFRVIHRRFTSLYKKTKQYFQLKGRQNWVFNEI